MRYGVAVERRFLCGLGCALGLSACAADADIGGLVFNEVEATIDFVELYNAGTEAIAVGGFKLADQANDGGPRAGRALAFPDATEVAAGDYLLIIGKVGGELPTGFQTDCLPDGPERCLHVDWGVSRDGEELFLLGPSDEELRTTRYPAGAVTEGQSWGRLPDGTGDDRWRQRRSRRRVRRCAGPRFVGGLRGRPHQHSGKSLRRPRRRPSRRDPDSTDQTRPRAAILGPRSGRMHQHLTTGKVEIDWTQTDGGHVVDIDGQIDDRCQLVEFAAKLHGKVVIDLEDVSFINSVGVREWMRVMDILGQCDGLELSLVNCSESMIRQMNMIEEAKGVARIESFFAPYMCETCGAESTLRIDVDEHEASLRAMDAPKLPCTSCDAVMVFNEIPQRYFLFLRD